MGKFSIYVSTEIAKIAQRKGFECFAIGTYPGDEDHNKIFNSKPDYSRPFYWYRPTAEEICNWLRLNGIHILIDYNPNNTIESPYKYQIYINSGPYMGWHNCGSLETYEQTLLTAIDNALDLI